jgi:hypothetical protein
MAIIITEIHSIKGQALKSSVMIELGSTQVLVVPMAARKMGP